ncbi:hypothetical protein A2856_00795 [Candidatus Uhrbacteria bacterium RIFCSPHIGHO2_01_FULL_63_20]|uniref:Uncharacterized protein n=1 Tax=Candidatus Uhrbacteria bacterium RIFCSPHIGHO2_01_FULL_63_20 TaxID=1802385 RepID=A0A1F7TM07_9BACT|nr:MAG: hypothetical protein A2856_00795 [Candidatus Uhrbacteria bacterium RIFCSPHIGHO2_01_FULL_63_20]
MALLAQSAGDLATGGLSQTGKAAGFGATALPIATLIGNLINVLLGFLGLILVGLLIYAGILYLTAGGAEERVKTAKRIMVNAVIGLVIVVSAYAISVFVIDQLSKTVSTTAPTGTAPLDDCPPGQIPAQGGGCF